MLSVIIVIVIIVLSVILAAIGAYVIIHSSDEKDEPKRVIDVSGQYAVVVRPARESLTAVKPSEASLRSWLDTQNIPLLTAAGAVLISGGISPFHAEVYFINLAALAVNWAIYARNKALDDKRRQAKAA